MAGPLGTKTNSPTIDPGTSARLEHAGPAARHRATPLSAAEDNANDPVSHYYVNKGDTLWSIAASKLGDATLYLDLMRLNNLAAGSILQINQRLIVPDFRRSDMTATFILGEMLTNARSQEAAQIAAAIARSKSAEQYGEEALEDMKKASWYEVFRTSGDRQIFNSMVQQSAFAMLEAKGRWFVQVREDGPWDHKPILKRMYESMPSPPRPFGAMGRAFHFPIRGDVFHEFYYDIWSNIHFGFVGTRCGFDEKTLQEGAASGFPGAGGNDEGDVLSTRIGVELWKNKGLSLTASDLLAAILARTSDYVAARAKEIAGGIKPDKATNVVITNNDYK